jgi:hypothetical protein
MEIFVCSKDTDYILFDYFWLLDQFKCMVWLKWLVIRQAENKTTITENWEVQYGMRYL